jgi:hypothetical protein
MLMGIDAGLVDPLLVTVVKSNELEVDKDDLTNCEA